MSVYEGVTLIEVVDRAFVSTREERRVFDACLMVHPRNQFWVLRIQFWDVLEVKFSDPVLTPTSLYRVFDTFDLPMSWLEELEDYPYVWGDAYRDYIMNSRYF